MLVLFSVAASALGGFDTQRDEFTEPFDNPAMPGWETDRASVKDGVLRIEAGGYAVHDAAPGDFMLTLTARYSGSGQALVGYGAADSGGYTLSLGQGVIVLRRQDVELGRSTHEIPPGEWALIQINVSGGAQTITLNNRQVITITNADALTAGGIRLGSSGAAAEFDHVNFAETAAQPGAVTTQALGEVTVLTNIPYAEVEGETLVLDIYQPGTPGPHPAIIQIHGGAFVGGHKDGAEPFGRLFAGWGYTLFAINYRLAPAHPFPAAVEDVQCAVRWVREHADEYAIDPKRIGLIGDSAGGNLAALAGLSAAADEPAAWQPSCGSALSPRGRDQP